VASHIDSTSITPTTTADGSFVIEPADAHTGIPGHQVNLDDGDNPVTITTSRPDHRPRTYTINVHRTPRDRPTVWDIEMLSEPARGSRNTYGVGDQISMRVIFDHPVSVDLSKGRPILSVDTQPDVSAHETLDFQYSQGSGSRSLYFQYIVPADLHSGPNTRLKLYLGANKLTASDNSITHATNGRAARLRHFAVGVIPDHQIDGRQHNSSPRLQSLSLTGLTLDPEFNPSTPLYIGSTDLGTTTTTVAATTADNARLIISPVDADPGADGHQVQLEHGYNEIRITAVKPVRYRTTYVVEAFVPVTPRIDSVEITSNSGPHLSYATGDAIEVAVAFTERVSVDTAGGVPYLPLQIGRDIRNATYSAIDSNRHILIFSYTVTDLDRDQNGLTIAANSLSLNGGSITYPGTANAAYLAHEGLPTQANHVVNKVPQIVDDGVRVTSTPLVGDTYGLAETITVSVTFDSAVRVDTTDGVPGVVVLFNTHHEDDDDADFYYVYGSGSDTLEFSYIVESGDRDSNGIFVGFNQLFLYGGAIKHLTTGQNANLRYDPPENNGRFTEHKVDGSIVSIIPPRILSVGFPNLPDQAGTYVTGDAIIVNVLFDEPVFVSHFNTTPVDDPTIDITIGTTTREAEFFGHSHNRTVLYFVYYVTAEDHDEDGISIAANSISIHGASVRNAADTADASVDHRAVPDQADHRVNAP